MIDKKKIKLVFSDELIEEFLVVAKRPKFKKHFSDSNIKELLRLFMDYGKLIKVHTSIQECRDVKDNFLLNLAIDSKADFLVTGDKDLLTLNIVRGTQIISLNDFLDKIS